jgi:mono/diheme cytochrome c family protein
MRLRAALVGLLLTASCRQDMHDQPREEPLKPSRFFRDGRSGRHPVEGTVARGQLRPPTPFFTGRRLGAPPVTSLVPAAATALSNKPDPSFSTDLVRGIPIPLTEDTLRRGQQRYAMFCLPCHGLTGMGDGIVVKRGFIAPPSYHSDRLRQAPAGHFFEVITNGYGAMFSYASRVGVEDRWAISAYLRALQYSQWSDLNDIPQAEQQRLNAAPQEAAP